MTLEQAKEFMWLENNKNPSVIKWQHHKTIRDLVEKLIDQIFNGHEAELEALQQPKNCDGCKYEHKDAYSLPCAACVRNCDSDYYEPKEQ